MAWKPIRPLTFEGDIAFVELTRGYRAIIDRADSILVGGHNWSANAHITRDLVYAVRNEWLGNGAAKSVKMHRVIINAPPGMEVDHIDGNGLNNRRSNLRLATRAQNARNIGFQKNNTSGFKGVFFCKQTGRWSAKIMVDGRTHWLGRFDTPEEAHNAYAQKAKELCGEFWRAA